MSCVGVSIKQLLVLNQGKEAGRGGALELNTTPSHLNMDSSKPVGSTTWTDAQLLREDSDAGGRSRRQFLLGRAAAGSTWSSPYSQRRGKVFEWCCSFSAVSVVVLSVNQSEVQTRSGTQVHISSRTNQRPVTCSAPSSTQLWSALIDECDCLTSDALLGPSGSPPSAAVDARHVAWKLLAL